MTVAFPHTIENGAGETLTFLRVVPTDRGDRLEVESRALAGAGPPMHVHHLQEEAMTVLSGKIGYQLPGGPPQYAEAGESVVFAPGVAHRWWNAGTTELHATGQTIVLVTHDEQLAQAYATRTIRLTDGHLTTDTAGPVGVARNATGATAGVPR